MHVMFDVAFTLVVSMAHVIDDVLNMLLINFSLIQFVTMFKMHTFKLLFFYYFFSGDTLFICMRFFFFFFTEMYVSI